MEELFLENFAISLKNVEKINIMRKYLAKAFHYRGLFQNWGFQKRGFTVLSNK